jgi:hypothetical protein
MPLHPLVPTSVQRLLLGGLPTVSVSKSSQRGMPPQPCCADPSAAPELLPPLLAPPLLPPELLLEPPEDDPLLPLPDDDDAPPELPPPLLPASGLPDAEGDVEAQAWTKQRRGTKAKAQDLRRCRMVSICRRCRGERKSPCG